MPWMSLLVMHAQASTSRAASWTDDRRAHRAPRRSRSQRRGGRLHLSACRRGGRQASFEESRRTRRKWRGGSTPRRGRRGWSLSTPTASVIGYAYAGPTGHEPAIAGRDSRSTCIPTARARVGRALYDELIARLRRQGFVNVYAGIALPNPASVALHEAIGMRRIGVYERVGYKFGAGTTWPGTGCASPSRTGRRPTRSRCRS